MIAISISEWFHNKENIELINKLKKNGLHLAMKSAPKKLSSKLEGFSFVVSGVFSKFSRDELKATIEQNGGKVLSGVSAKTSYLVAGEESGPSKLNKAQKLGVKVISEHEFINLLNE